MLLPEARARSLAEIRCILATIEGANAGSGGVGGQDGGAFPGVRKVLSAYGIAGFVRHLEGYYVIFIVRRSKCATIGMHAVYKIEETRTVYVPNSDSRISHADEARWGKK